MFPVRKYKFQVLKYKFQDLEHKFQVLKYKIIKDRNNYTVKTKIKSPGQRALTWGLMII